MSELKFHSIAEVAEYLATLENQIVELEKQKHAKMNEYRNVSSQILGAPTFGELTSSKLCLAIDRLISLSKPVEVEVLHD